MIQVPGYLIKREVGTGGMATVYLAVQSSLEREVALKVMNPALVSDPNFSRRFLLEARTLASLSHPNIVAVYDVGVTDSQLHYFSMQNLPGGDFVRRIKNGVGEHEILRILAGVARALGFAHVRGFVHRDVSPANILFDASDNPILTDFGIARAVTRTSRLTNAGVSVGTSHYMSPEQARGGNVDARSDIYSLGAVAYEALVGQPPFDGEDGFAIAYAHVFEPVPRLPAAFAHWQPHIDQALAKHPNDRFADLDAFLLGLDRVAETIGAPPTTGQQRIISAATIANSSTNTNAYADIPRTEVQPVPPLIAPVIVATTNDEDTGPRPVIPADFGEPEAIVPAAGGSGAKRWIIAAAAALLVIGGIATALLSMDRQEPGKTVEVAPTPTIQPTPQTVAPSSTPANVDIAPTPVASAGDTNPYPALDDPAVDPAATEYASDPTTPDDGLGFSDPYASVDTGDAEDPEALKQALATTVVDPLNLVLALARNDLAGKRLGNPPGRNSLERFRLAQHLADHFGAKADLDKATKGVVDTASAYIELAEKSLLANNVPEFLGYMKNAEDIAKSLPEGAAVATQVAQRRNALRDEALAQGMRAITAWKKNDAIAAYQRALALDPTSANAQKGLKAAQRVGDVGFVFRDVLKSGAGPEMVVLAANGKKIAIERNETTLGEFRAYWSAEGSRTRGADRPSCQDREFFLRSSRKNTFESPAFPQDASQPVVCVSWGDAEGFAGWLSQQTGHRYRLPTEAEWRAVAQGAANVAPCKANLADRAFDQAYGNRSAFPCDDGFAATAPVRRFDATAGGVYDMAGNVREWIGDCAAGCKEHGAMGSAWLSTIKEAEVGHRETFKNDAALNSVGFRVVRDLD